VCEGNYGDCNGDLALGATDGCETDLRSSSDHCGSCDNACPLEASAEAVCVAGACSLSCTAGTLDCNRDLGTGGDGCETVGSSCECFSTEWAVSVDGPSGTDHPVAGHLDASGNYYAMGYLLGTATFGADTLTATSTRDSYVWSLDSTGAHRFAVSGGTGSDQATGGALDTAGNVYLVGEYSSATQLGTTDLAFFGDDDVFVWSLDPTGTHRWAARASGSDVEHGGGVAVDAAGNIYVTGTYRAPMSSARTLLYAADGSVAAILRRSGAFVWSLDSDGNHRWVILTDGGTPSGHPVIDSFGNLIVVGSFRETVDFGAETLTSASTTFNDWFVWSIDISTSPGTPRWARRGGGPSFDDARSVTADSMGNLYVAGDAGGDLSVTFGSTSFTGFGGSDAVVWSLSREGEHRWATRGGGMGSEKFYDVATDDLGTVYAVGQFSGAGVYGPTSLPAPRAGDAILARLSAATGAFECAQGHGGTGPSGEGAYTVAASGRDIYVSGRLGAEITFGATTLSGFHDTFVARLR